METSTAGAVTSAVDRALRFGINAVLSRDEAGKDAGFSNSFYSERGQRMPDIRAELSTKNQYWISKHRFYEVYHFCLQYNEWRDEYRAMDGLRAVSCDAMPRGSTVADPTAALAARRAALRQKMELVERTATATDAVLGKYLLKAVTNEGIPYTYLREVMGMPCGRNQYYALRRKFYWVLSEVMNETHLAKDVWMERKKRDAEDDNP